MNALSLARGREQMTMFSRSCQISEVSANTKTVSVRFKANGQVVIPGKFRKQFGIEDGTKAIVQATPEGILLKPVTEWATRRGIGLLKRTPGDRSFAEEWAEHKREEMELEEAKYVRCTGSR